VFKLAKKHAIWEFSRYMMRSVNKYFSMGVFLTGAIITFCVSDKKMIQRLAES